MNIEELVKEFLAYAQKINMLKALACKKLGYNFEFRIYGRKGDLIEKIKI